MSQIVAIAGSPRRGGNSEILLDHCISGVERAGITPIKFIPSEMKIRPCRGCHFCLKQGKCVIQDEFIELHEAILAAEGLIIATPVFFYHIPSTLKAVIDRFQVEWSRIAANLPSRSVKKRGMLIGVGATHGKLLFKGIELTVKNFLSTINGTLEYEFVYRGFDEPGSILEAKDTIAEVEQGGFDLASSIFNK